MKDFHPVVEHDTLGRISKTYGVSIHDLCIINQIRNPDRLEIGQRIYLRKEKVLGVQALVLDRQRNPIEGLRYQLHFGGKVISRATQTNGLTRKIQTSSPDEKVDVLVERLDKSMKRVATVVSGYGSKLITLISPRIKVEAKTEPHPISPKGRLPPTKEPVKPAFDPKAKQPPTSNQPLGVHPKPAQTPDGKPITVVTGEVPDVDFLDEYNGESMTEADYAWAAKELGVEHAAIKAFAVVESGGSGFLKIGKRTVPKILYERHKFSKLTGHRHSAKYPDISLPTAYYNAKTKYVVADSAYKRSRGIPGDVQYYRAINKKDSKETKAGAVTLSDMLKSGVATAERDKYLAGEGSYRRLLKAYQLDQEAALESCSWGAFQIMGEYWKTMQYASAKEFARSVSRSPKEQIKSFVMYIKYVNPVIRKHLIARDWDATARAYNGPGYKANNYDEKLAAAYKKFKGEK